VGKTSLVALLVLSSAASFSAAGGCPAAQTLPQQLELSTKCNKTHLAPLLSCFDKLKADEKTPLISELARRIEQLPKDGPCDCKDLKDIASKSLAALADQTSRPAGSLPPSASPGPEPKPDDRTAMERQSFAQKRIEGMLSGQALSDPLPSSGGTAVAPRPAPAPVVSALEFGDRGRRVRAFQAALNVERKTQGLKPISEDGVYGRGTLRAVALQKKNATLLAAGGDGAETRTEIKEPTAPKTPGSVRHPSARAAPASAAAASVGVTAKTARGPRVRVQVYGPSVGEFSHDQLYGPLGKLRNGDVALSPDLLKHHRMGSHVTLNGVDYRVADVSYISPGRPNHNTAEIWNGLVSQAGSGTLSP
jgi:hypothetical protein